MPAQRMNFAVPIADSAAFVKDALIDEVLLPGERLADGAVVVSTELPADDPGMVHVSLDVYT